MKILGAFFHYALWAGRNRVVTWFRRLRSPRHLIGFVLVVAYFWWLVVRPMSRFLDDPRAPVQAAGMVIDSVAVLLYFQCAMALIFGPFSKGIVFKESEVQILFPAPLLRRDLLFFKWLQSQGGSIIFALLMSVGVARWAQVPYLPTALLLWLASNFMNLVGNCASLTLLRLKERKLPVPLLMIPGLAMIALLFTAFWRDWPDPDSPRHWAEAMTQATQGPWVGVILAPFRFLIEGMVAEDLEIYFRSLGALLVSVGVLAWLVTKIDYAFEENSAALAEVMTRARSEGLEAFVSSTKNIVPENYRPLFALPPIGPRWMAFVWKNSISIGRMSRRAGIGLMFVVVVAFMSSVLGNRGSDSGNIAVMAVLGVVIFYSALYGATVVRVDLRLDIPHFDVIRAMPIRGRHLILGEVLATSAVLFAIQTGVVLLAILFLSRLGPHEVTIGEKLFYGPSVLFVVLGLDLVLVTAENLLALVFPSFVKLGRGMRQGVDHFGQQLIGAIVKMFAWLIFVAIPGFLAWVIGFGLYAWWGFLPAVALASSMLFCVLMVLESWLLMLLGEKRYDAYDLTGENLSVD